jgi:hypothetical protein
MTRYILSSAAESLSNALWALSRPSAVSGSDDTQFLFPWLTATDGTRWLIVDTTYEVYVHSNAVLNGIAAILQPWIDAGHLPADTNQELATFVETKRGQHLVIYEAFPPLFKSLSKTREEMQALNLLPPDPQP